MSSGQTPKFESDDQFVVGREHELMDAEDVYFDQNFGIFGKMERNENMMLEKMIDKDFYNDFGDLYDPEAGAPES
ncbi:hypothetical protein DdX_14385 [Ditylenchus destructor]|nr:hypothetical protein DdX_14385 [Ditylenchus destructor]